MDALENYWKLSETEQRFNTSSAGIRTLASAWILGALAALGWLLDPAKAGQDWQLPVGVLASVVCALATAGIATLWVLDQLVFHRLLSSVFIVGLRLEAACPSLPPVRWVMMKTMEGEGTHRWERLFYLSPLLVFTLVSALMVFAGPEPSASMSPAVQSAARPIGLLLLAAQLAIVVWFLAKQPALSVIDRAQWFDDASFTERVQRGAFDEVISQWRPASHDASAPRRRVASRYQRDAGHRL